VEGQGSLANLKLQLGGDTQMAAKKKTKKKTAKKKTAKKKTAKRKTKKKR
jgi:hypothetical protein